VSNRLRDANHDSADLVGLRNPAQFFGIFRCTRLSINCRQMHRTEEKNSLDPAFRKRRFLDKDIDFARTGMYTSSAPYA
jgi:hypothetical protein